MPERARQGSLLKRQRRIEHPLTIRSWVKDLEPEEIHRELLARVEAFDASIAPARDVIIRHEQLATERVLRQLGLEELVPKVLAVLDDPSGPPRLYAMILVANYYRAHPHVGGGYLPPIALGGDPSAPPPDMIHVFDLPIDHIRRAVTARRPDPKQTDALLLKLTRDSSRDAEFLAVLGAQAIRVQGLGAIFNPVFQAALFANLARAHFGASVAEARQSAVLATEMFDMFLPDLSRHMSRRPDQLLELKTRWRHDQRAAHELLGALRSEGVSSKTRALAREQFGRRITIQDLKRWAREAPTADSIADELMRRERRISPKTLRDYRRLWGQAEAIDEAWREFGEYFNQLSLEEQRRIVPVTQPLDSSPSEAPPKS